jgi:apolipoprotein N-acyltransferase
VVWPENASDLNPEFSPRANLELNSLVNRELKTPFTFGTITATESDIFNSSILWLPNAGFADQYDKKRPVPFAEFVPDRDFWYQLAPDLIGLISRGYTFGERDPIFEVDGKKFGVLICFEIAIDEITQDIVDSGAQAILSQTNNADFGRSDEAFQQLAIAKLRSIETGLPLVNASTVGPSAIFDGGDTLARSGAFEPAYLVADIGLSNSKTPAMVIGRYFDLANLLLAASLVSIVIYRRRKTN